MGNGSRVKSKALDKNILLVTLFSKDNIYKVRDMEKVHILFLMEAFRRGNGNKVK